MNRSVRTHPERAMIRTSDANISNVQLLKDSVEEEDLNLNYMNSND